MASVRNGLLMGSLAADREAKGVEFGVFFLPARSHVCEKVFAEEGVFGDVHIGDYPLNFIPFDSDILSLELPSSFKVDDLQRTLVLGVASLVAFMYSGTATLVQHGLLYKLHVQSLSGCGLMLRPVFGGQAVMPGVKHW